MYGKGDSARLPGCEGEAGKTEQYAHGTGDRGDQVAEYQQQEIVATKVGLA